MSSDEIIRKLSEQRQNVWELAKEINERAADESRDLDGEEEAAWQKANADLDRLDERIRSIAAAEKRAADNAAAMEALERQPQTRQAATDGDAFRAFLTGQTREFSVPVEMRDQVKGTAASGGDTVPTSFSSKLWEHLVENAAVLSVCEVLRTSAGENLEMPITTSHQAAAIIAEAGSITESDAAFAKRTLGAYKYAYSFQVSSELLTDTAVDLQGYFARQAGQVLGNKFGTDLAVGNASSKPSGVVQTATVGKTGGTGVAGVPTGDELIDLYYSVISPYRNSAKCVWMFRDTTAASIRKIKDSSGGAGVGNYLWTPGFGVAPDTILGKRVVIDPNIAATAVSAKSVVFGDFSAYVARIVGGVRYERSDDFSFANDMVTFRAILRGDGLMIDQSGALKVFQGGAS